MDGTAQLLESDRRFLVHPLHHPEEHKAPLLVESGTGAMLHLADGREVIDGLAGLWNVNVGHGRGELADAAAGQMRKIAYASAGPGSTNHLCAALFEKMTGIQMVHVPYRGGAPAVADTVSGQTQLFFTAGTQSLEHVKAGKLRLLAVTEGKRSSLLPDVPTVAETIPGFEMAVWYGAFGPKGMPPELTRRLNSEINTIMMLPDVKAKMEAIGVESVNETPEQFAAVMRADAEKWGRLVRELNIKSE